MKWIIILSCLLVAGLPTNNGKITEIINPGHKGKSSLPETLESKVLKRMVEELPQVAYIYPHSGSGNLSRGIGFFIGQEDMRDKIAYEKVVANEAYRQGDRQKKYLKEETVGTADFYIFANNVTLSVDFDHSGPIWRQSPIEKANTYNKMEAKRRSRGNLGTTQNFQMKRPLPGMSRDQYMTSREHYNYASTSEYTYPGATGQMYVARDKCLVSGYPIEYYNGFVFRVFEGDIPTEIDMRVLLSEGDQDLLIKLHSTTTRNHGLPDRILHVQQAEDIMNAMIRIILEETGQRVPSQALKEVDAFNEKGRPIPGLGASIQGLKLYAGSKKGVPSGSRTYSNSFPASQAGTIWWEIEFSPLSGKSSNPLMEVILFNPKGEAIDRAAVNLNITSDSKHVHALNKKGYGPWDSGRYLLNFYISGERVAGTFFQIKR